MWQIRSFGDDCFLERNEFEASLSAAGTVQSESRTSRARWFCCVALWSDQCPISSIAEVRIGRLEPFSFVFDKRHIHVLRVPQALYCAATT